MTDAELRGAKSDLDTARQRTANAWAAIVLDGFRENNLGSFRTMSDSMHLVIERLFMLGFVCPDLIWRPVYYIDKDKGVGYRWCTKQSFWKAANLLPGGNALWGWGQRGAAIAR